MTYNENEHGYALQQFCWARDMMRRRREAYHSASIGEDPILNLGDHSDLTLGRSYPDEQAAIGVVLEALDRVITFHAVAADRLASERLDLAPDEECWTHRYFVRGVTR